MMMQSANGRAVHDATGGPSGRLAGQFKEKRAIDRRAIRLFAFPDGPIHLPQPGGGAG
jgi:hypothetical protein